MRIRMLRNAMVIANGSPYGASVGECIDLDVRQAQLLVNMGKAAPVVSAESSTAPHLVGVEHAVDVGAMTAERRSTDWGEALVTDIDGIGPVIARRLAEAGIETMADLLAADATQVALIASVRPAQAEKWRQRAAAVVRGEP